MSIIPAADESALAMYAEGLAGVGTPADESDGPWFLRYDDGNRIMLELARWCADVLPGDDSLVERCVGPTLDVGCGPGRLAAAVRRRELPVLGLDISPEAVRIARGRGALVVQGSVFDELPAEGTWTFVLLADGNVGIGGDPARLLRRCAEVMAADGQLLVELDPPGTPSFAGPVWIETATGRRSDSFPWAHLSLDGVEPVAAVAGLTVAECWTDSGRWFASLRK